jgi:hypothetical protein
MLLKESERTFSTIEQSICLISMEQLESWSSSGAGA